MSKDLYKDVTQGASSVVELSIKQLSVLNNQSKKDKMCEIWSVSTHSEPARVNQCSTRGYAD